MTYSGLKRKVKRFFKRYQSIPTNSFHFYLKELVSALDYKTDNLEVLERRLIRDLRNQTYISEDINQLYLRSLPGPLTFPSENNLVLKFELEFVIRKREGLIKSFNNPDGSLVFLYKTSTSTFLVPLPSFNKEHPYYYKEGSKIILSNHNYNSHLNICYLAKNKQTLNRTLKTLNELNPGFKWNSSETIWISE